ncbi:MAG: sensor histidine kinase, partial [Oscillospiraceae bacterium]|nr:sensor histidine kinase [Oscillospiraceae bacterium]
FLSLLAAILSFVALMSVAGRRPDTEEIISGPFSFIPFEIFVAAAVGIVIVMILAVEGSNGMLEGVIGCASAVIALCLFIGLSMCAASRIKQKTFFQNTLTAKALMLISGCLGAAWGITKKVLGYFRQGLQNMSVMWKTVLVYLGFSFAELIAVGATDETDVRVVMFILERTLILPAVVIIAVSLKKLYAGGQALARGDLAHYTDTKGMFWDLKRHGEDLNSIASGMAIAVEDRLKSERMKAELITNVSHDIKTPLTSIINYASLIGEEEGTSEKTKEYTEVLVRQSERLKRLLEDLVEASKASTGNLDVDLMQCDAGVFLDQASGEYSEKLAEADLTLVTRSPEKEVRILADGRRMWRIFDNLMNNICKYSMPGTRVYLSLEEEDGKAVFTFKNTSKDELNISEEELMERFTRGDSSRNTEGNGLGLSIARSMAELQNGALDLSIDGDLFKAILTFPVIG